MWRSRMRGGAFQLSLTGSASDLALNAISGY